MSQNERPAIAERKVAQLAADSACAIALTAMAKRFGRYAPEEEKFAKGLKREESEVLARLASAFRNISPDENDIYDIDLAGEHIGSIKYSSLDVSKFCLSFGSLCGESDGLKIGTFISALIKYGQDGSYAINTECLGIVDSLGEGLSGKTMRICGDAGDLLGHGMTKGKIELHGDCGREAGGGMKGGEIHVTGDAGNETGCQMYDGLIRVSGNSGDSAGQQMFGGTIIIMGNAGDGAGCALKGGVIEIHGDAGGYVGSGFAEVARLMRGSKAAVWPMKGGKIIIHGNAGEFLGHMMKGGEIHVMGGIRSIGEVEHGKVFHKGKLIVDK